VDRTSNSIFRADAYLCPYVQVVFNDDSFTEVQAEYEGPGRQLALHSFPVLVACLLCGQESSDHIFYLVGVFDGGKSL
jgi:hypothetical protein